MSATPVSPTSKGVWKRLYSQREDSNAPLLFVRKSAKGDFSLEVKQRILNDLADEELRLTREAIQSKRQKIDKADLQVRQCAKTSICEYYDIGMRSLETWAVQRVDGQLTPKLKSGRRSVIDSPVKYAICETRNQENGKSQRAVASALVEKTLTHKNGKRYETKYKGKSRTSPSKSSIRRVLQDGELCSVKTRPQLTTENKRVRYTFAVEEMGKSDPDRNDNVVALDECYFTTQQSGTGTLVKHPKGPVIKKDQLTREVRNKRHPTKVMALAVISRPKMLNQDTAGKGKPAVFDPVQNGKVGIFRCVTEEEYKKTVYCKKAKLEGRRVVLHKKGDKRVVSCILDGDRYKEMLTKDGGVFDKIREYFGPEVTVRLQEDGAPGHGYDNRNKRRPTAAHDAMVQEANRRKIEVFKQPHNSPETNPLDLGIWYALQAKVRQTPIPAATRENDGYAESQLWEAVKTAWDQLEPRTIWNCWMVKDEILKELKRIRGGVITSEPHSKVRDTWGTHEPNI